MIGNQLNEVLAPFLFQLYVYLILQATFVTYGNFGGFLNSYSRFLGNEKNNPNVKESLFDPTLTNAGTMKKKIPSIQGLYFFSSL